MRSDPTRVFAICPTYARVGRSHAGQHFAGVAHDMDCGQCIADRTAHRSPLFVHRNVTVLVVNASNCCRDDGRLDCAITFRIERLSCLAEALAVIEEKFPETFRAFPAGNDKSERNELVPIRALRRRNGVARRRPGSQRARGGFRPGAGKMAPNGTVSARQRRCRSPTRASTSVFQLPPFALSTMPAAQFARSCASRAIALP